jgi:hypothetical protein
VKQECCIGIGDLGEQCLVRFFGYWGFRTMDDPNSTYLEDFLQSLETLPNSFRRECELVCLLINMTMRFRALIKIFDRR